MSIDAGLGGPMVGARLKSAVERARVLAAAECALAAQERERALADWTLARDGPALWRALHVNAAHTHDRAAHLHEDAALLQRVHQEHLLSMHRVGAT